MKVVVVKAPDMPGGCSVEDDPSEIAFCCIACIA